ncbi:MAG: hypothetical protein WBF53_07455 [Litorimonas sp.]
MSDAALMTALRIKGFAKAEALAETLGLDADAVALCLSDLAEQGYVSETRIGAKLTPKGQGRADSLTAEERASVPALDWDALYDEFHHLNGPFKQTIADWQIRDGAPNDHTDAAYDDTIRARIDETHTGIGPVLEKLGAKLPRLSRYADRFETAIAAVRAGENRMVAAPIIDSYHTVWFELHEDLIRLSGRTRAEEALAGRAV